MKKMLVLLGLFMIIVMAMVFSAEQCNENVTPCGGGCNGTDMSHMFQSVTNFDATIGDITGWNTSCITDMHLMFSQSDFNQDISGWDVSSVTDMGGVFFLNDVFNQPIGSWDMSSVTSLCNTFNGATSFDQDISSWDISNVTNMCDLFGGVTLSVSNYDSLLVQWSTLEVVPIDLTLNGGYSQYSSAGLVGRDILTGTYNWTITDGGLLVTYPTAPEGMFAYDLGQDAGMGESLVLMWNDSTTNQSTLTYDCRIDSEWGFTCDYFEPPANITYELEFTNDSGVNWFYMPPDNYSGCDPCFEATGGNWLHGSTFLDSLNFSEGNLTFRVRALDGVDHSGWTESNEVRNCYAVWNCTESNTSDCLINDYYTCLNTTDISGCGWGYTDGENALYLQDVITNKEVCDYCTPDWNCTGYASCSVNDTQVCNDVTDLNDCFNQTGLSSDNYSGNFSEFTPQVCDYCTPDWNCTGYSTNCTGGHLAYDEATDINICGELYTGNYSEFTPQNCTAPPITGYVAQYGAGDLSKLIVDNLGEIILTLISMVGIVVLVVVIGWGAKKIKTGIKGR